MKYSPDITISKQNLIKNSLTVIDHRFRVNPCFVTSEANSLNVQIIFY